MGIPRPNRAPVRCAYIRACLLAEEMKCFGFKTDCPLYQKSNGQRPDESLLREAMGKLINKARARLEKLPG